MDIIIVLTFYGSHEDNMRWHSYSVQYKINTQKCYFLKYGFTSSLVQFLPLPSRFLFHHYFFFYFSFSLLTNSYLFSKSPLPFPAPSAFAKQPLRLSR